MSNQWKVSLTKVKDFEENNKLTVTYRAVIQRDRDRDFLLSLKDVKYITHQRGHFVVQGKIHVRLHLDLYKSENQKQKEKFSSSFRKCTVLWKMTAKVRKIVLSLYHVYLSRKGWDDECMYRVSCIPVCGFEDLPALTSPMTKDFFDCAGRY